MCGCVRARAVVMLLLLEVHGEKLGWQLTNETSRITEHNEKKSFVARSRFDGVRVRGVFMPN